MGNDKKNTAVLHKCYIRFLVQSFDLGYAVKGYFCIFKVGICHLSLVFSPQGMLAPQ